jgi:hypothetical protein
MTESEPYESEVGIKVTQSSFSVLSGLHSISSEAR